MSERGEAFKGAMREVLRTHDVEGLPPSMRALAEWCIVNYRDVATVRRDGLRLRTDRDYLENSEISGLVRAAYLEWLGGGVA